MIRTWLQISIFFRWFDQKSDPKFGENLESFPQISSQIHGCQSDTMCHVILKNFKIVTHFSLFRKTTFFVSNSVGKKWEKNSKIRIQIFEIFTQGSHLD